MYDLRSFFHCCFFCTTNGNGTFIINVNLHTCLFDDCVNRFSALSYNIADLLRIDLHLNDLRCKFTDFCSWLRNCLIHDFVNDIGSGFLCRRNCLFNDRSCKSVNLNIHLNSCNTFMCTGYFKVHISEEVFQSLDIGKNKIVIVCISSYKTCGNTGYCSFDRYSGCHKRHTGCAYACL